MVENKELKNNKILDIDEVMSLLPHRYPFLLIDKVIDYEDQKWLKAIKNITINEPCFTGHFPKKPIFPGVLILEAMAQATGLLAFTSFGIPKEEIYYLASVDKARFKIPVRPGDQMEIEVHYVKHKRGITKFTAVAKVDSQVVCEAELMCARRGV
ncbi:MAG: 3-hydroxyacyl-ACP dehydratase FabZ [Psittacicella sp.]